MLERGKALEFLEEIKASHGVAVVGGLRCWGWLGVGAKRKKMVIIKTKKKEMKKLRKRGRI